MTNAQKIAFPAKGDTINVAATVRSAGWSPYEGDLVVLRDQDGVPYNVAIEEVLWEHICEIIKPAYRVPTMPHNTQLFDNYGSLRDTVWTFTARVKDVVKYYGEPQVKVSDVKIDRLVVTDYALRRIESMLERVYQEDSWNVCRKHELDCYTGLTSDDSAEQKEADEIAEWLHEYEDKRCICHRDTSLYDRVRYYNGKPVGLI